MPNLFVIICVVLVVAVIWKVLNLVVADLVGKEKIADLKSKSSTTFAAFLSSAFLAAALWGGFALFGYELEIWYVVVFWTSNFVFHLVYDRFGS